MLTEMARLEGKWTVSSGSELQPDVPQDVLLHVKA
jgi:hypothetical protein